MPSFSTPQWPHPWLFYFFCPLSCPSYLFSFSFSSFFCHHLGTHPNHLKLLATVNIQYISNNQPFSILSNTKFTSKATAIRIAIVCWGLRCPQSEDVWGVASKVSYVSYVSYEAPNHMAKCWTLVSSSHQCHLWTGQWSHLRPQPRKGTGIPTTLTASDQWQIDVLAPDASFLVTGP